MSWHVEMDGKKYGILTCVGFSHRSKMGHYQWKFDCDCGTKDYVSCGSQVRIGRIKSCGCKKGNIKHGLKKVGNSREYASYSNMISRCYNPSNKYYSYYGGRGIKVCERWLGITEEEALLIPHKQLRKRLNETHKGLKTFFSDMGKRPPEHTLDKVDNNKNYSPDNCRWATRHVQQMNRRKQVGCVSKYIGVTYCNQRPHIKDKKRWIAQCKAGSVTKSKMFHTEEEALKHRNCLIKSMNHKHACIQEWRGETKREI